MGTHTHNLTMQTRNVSRIHSDHVGRPLVAGGTAVTLCWYAVVGVSVAKTAAFDNKIIDGVVVGGQDSSSGMFGLAGTPLLLQQTDPQVGDHELVLSSGAIGIHGKGRRHGSIDHLHEGRRENETFTDLLPSCCSLPSQGLQREHGE